MSAIIEPTNTIIPTIKREMGFFERIRLTNTVTNHKFARLWNYRNYDHGEIFASSLEVEYIIFQQNMFIQDSKEITSKLARLGYKELYEYPDKKQFETFTRVMYHEKHNIAVSLYQPQHKEAIHLAHKIVKKTALDHDAALIVFLSSVSVLLTK
jgi:ATP sulfurylase